MADIFQEVDEEVRREQLQKLWERYQNLIIAGLILILAGVGGWRLYEWWETKKAAEVGAAFEAAQILSQQDKHADAEDAFGKIAAEGTASYRSLASVRRAAELAQRDPKSAIAAYEQLAEDSSLGSGLQDLAALRAGSLLIDQGSYSEARSRLEPIAAEGRPYRYAAREFLALSAWRAGDTAGAKRWFDQIVTDIQTPPSTRSRVEMLIALVAAGGGT